jgi:hypothetical protein
VVTKKWDVLDADEVEMVDERDFPLTLSHLASVKEEPR